MATERGQQTRRRIIEAAAELMFRHGVAGTSIPAVQEAAAVSASQVYHYFGDKTGLVRAVIAHRLNSAEESGAFRPSRFDSIAALEAWRDTVIALQIERDCVGGCEFGALVSELADSAPVYRGDAVDGYARLEAPIRDGLRAMKTRAELPADVDTDTLALALLAALQGGLLMNKARRDVAALRAILDTVIDQIRHLSTGQSAKA
ncbi:MAG TPA: helix-turn-helix domain-containing protein [Pseudonocardia sp.]|jgi:AcrR family transcriptional regulator